MVGRNALYSAICLCIHVGAMFILDLDAPKSDAFHWLVVLAVWLSGAFWIAFGVIALSEYQHAQSERASRQAGNA